LVGKWKMLTFEGLVMNPVAESSMCVSVEVILSVTVSGNNVRGWKRYNISSISLC